MYQVFYKEDDWTCHGYDDELSLIKTLSITKNYGLKNIKSVRVEEGFDNIRPDIIASIDGQDYLIEVTNTHFVDDTKLHKIKRMDIPTIEIDVSHLTDISYSSIKRLILSRNDRTYWLHYKNSLKERFLKLREEFELKSISYQKQLKNMQDQRAIELEKQKQSQEQRKKEAKLQIQKNRSEADQINSNAEAQGLIKLVSTLKQIKFAVNIRAERIRKFGKEDLLVTHIRDAGKWIECKKRTNFYTHVHFVCWTSLNGMNSKSKKKN